MRLDRDGEKRRNMRNDGGSDDDDEQREGTNGDGERF